MYNPTLGEDLLCSIAVNPTQLRIMHLLIVVQHWTNHRHVIACRSEVATPPDIHNNDVNLLHGQLIPKQFDALLTILVTIIPKSQLMPHRQLDHNSSTLQCWRRAVLTLAVHPVSDMISVPP